MLLAFLRLGCRSFGGPAAHLGYFHTELVERRGWCSEAEYAETLALAQSLPGPASSQVAFALGLLRGGWLGGLAAWTGFTMPSAILLFCFAWERSWFTGAIWSSVLHGLHLVAAAVVAQAVLTMQRSLASTWPLRLLALISAGVALFVSSAFTTVAIIAISAAIGGLLQSGSRAETEGTKEGRFKSVSVRSASMAATVFVVLLTIALIPARVTDSGGLKVFGAFYRTGALVFGGGHVVLPLLEHAVVTPGWVDEPNFLEGYGMAQAVPGPLFTFAAYLGAVLKMHASADPMAFKESVAMSLLALVSIFLPGLLLMVAVLPIWQKMRRNARFWSSLRLVNASVVGILLASLIHPVGTTAIRSWIDLPIALAALAALVKLKAPPWAIVFAVVLVSVTRGLAGI